MTTVWKKFSPEKRSGKQKVLKVSGKTAETKTKKTVRCLQGIPVGLDASPGSTVPQVQRPRLHRYKGQGSISTEAKAP